jgi:hypothetical protein
LTKKNSKQHLPVFAKGQEEFERNARKAAICLTSVAYEQNLPWSEIREVLGAVFGEDTHLCKKGKHSG